MDSVVNSDVVRRITVSIEQIAKCEKDDVKASIVRLRHIGGNRERSEMLLDPRQFCIIRVSDKAWDG